MITVSWIFLALGGLCSGIVAGFLGIGGGTLLVPLLITLGYGSDPAIATSSLAIVITASSGTIQNWRMGYIKLDRILYIGLPGIISALLGVYIGKLFPGYIRLFSFGLLLLFNLYLIQFRKQVIASKEAKRKKGFRGQIEKFKSLLSGQQNEPKKQGWNFKFKSYQSQSWQKKLGTLGLVGFIAGVLGGYLQSHFPFAPSVFTTGALLFLNLYLVKLSNWGILKVKTKNKAQEKNLSQNYQPILARVATGGAAGVLSGLFGVGGGVIMVPLQILLLGESIKAAIQTSLGVIVITSISSCVGHAFNGDVMFIEGIVLGTGGLIGAQISTRFLPKLPSEWVTIAFRALLIILSIYTFWQAWQIYNSETLGGTSFIPLYWWT